MCTTEHAENFDVHSEKKYYLRNFFTSRISCAKNLRKKNPLRNNIDYTNLVKDYYISVLVRRPEG